GVPIDYFAEINLAGFYDLAQSLDGVEVCLKEAVYDEYSGANFPAGRQTLNAEEALAFVRQRHGLDNGDLDRTHRQQAFLVSVMRQLQDAGTFTDLAKLQKLIAVARKNIVLSAGWDEHQFQRIGELAGGKVEYRTLPVVRYDNIDGQDVNIINPAAIKAEVAAAFGTGQPTTVATPTSPPDPSTVIDVINASSTTGLGSQVARILKKSGYTIGELRSRESGEPTSTSVDYGSGGAAAASIVAGLIGVDAADQADSSVAADHIRIFIGDDYTPQAQYPSSTETTKSNYSAADQDATIETEPTPDRGKPIDGVGIPCVN
ncbi:MAG: LCP family protein, partial [Mycobacteriaceae bacterium]|nr:LCP family protein [Mycobacteriaceae bacterium]